MIATPTDVQERWRTLTDAESDVAAVIILDAEEILRSRIPDLDTRLADETLSTDLVIGVICRMVLRVMRNPDGKVSESIDDYTYRRSDAVADGSLYLSDVDANLLSPAGSSSSAFTITPSGTPGYATGIPASLLGWS